MYENQIRDLQKKQVTSNAEFQSFKRTSCKLSIKADPELLARHLQIVHDLEVIIKELKAEIKYLTEKNDFLNKDLQNQKESREKEVKFIKEELQEAGTMAVNAKVQLAQVCFEKDDIIMQLKTLNKKLKTKVITLQGGIASGTTLTSTVVIKK